MVFALLLDTFKADNYIPYNGPSSLFFTKIVKGESNTK